ncbi:MAG: glycosyltransferase family 2 protein [Candidatus Brocadiaceae bacterium]|nr:glycosyltransferase family 2 protein [Candidatus Brocadiaceae bacterium]
MDIKKNKTLIAIPVFNETNVLNLIQKIQAFPLDILVVDDGSTNNFSNELCSVENIRFIVHSRNIGYGKTICDAFQYAMQNEYDYLLTIDADGQHEPEEIQLFLDKIPFNDFDILSGSRYLSPVGNEFKAPQDRFLINKEITRIIGRITGYNVTDTFCGFKAYKVRSLGILSLTEVGYGMPVQLWLQAWKMGLRVKEIAVKLIYKDLLKQFTGTLSNPQIRLQYYKDIIENELNDSKVVNRLTQTTRSK